MKAAVTTLRGGNRLPVSDGDPSLETMPVAETLAVLRRAISTETPVRISVADGDGLVDPLRLQAGVLTAVDRVTGEVRTYPVAQIQAAGLAAHTP